MIAAARFQRRVATSAARLRLRMRAFKAFLSPPHTSYHIIYYCWHCYFAFRRAVD